MTSNKRKGFVISLMFAVLFILSTVIYLEENSFYWETFGEPTTVKSLPANFTAPLIGTPQTTMAQRLKVKSEACKSLKANKEAMRIKSKTRNYSPQMMYSKEFNISYCGVGKAGGTFIRQLFSIIMLGENVTHWLENITRIKTHHVTGKFNVPFGSSIWKKSRLITVGRNPYTRLFSAYMDKVFQASHHPPIRNGGDCKFDINFQQFLRYVVKSAKNGLMDQHWSPIYIICQPCDVISTFIVKQETLSSDLKFIIESLGLSNETKAAVYQKLRKSPSKDIVTGITKDLHNNARKTFTKPGCVGWRGAVERMWRAFQIQGHINENIDLPVHLFNETNDFSDESLIVKVMTGGITEHPLSKEESKAQRHKALLDAYKTVDNKTIEEIKQLFEPDFKLFGYSTDPPS